MENTNLSYSSLIGVLKNTYKSKLSLEKDLKKMRKDLREQQTLYVRMINAQKILSTVSDENTNQVLNFITGMVNKVLAEIFSTDPVYITMKKKLFAGSKPHIILEVKDSSGTLLDTTCQVGTGLNQIISFMYVICLIEVRKGRRLLILDERLNGLHLEAKRFMSHIMQIFVKGGFQFIFVEYSLNNIGKIYNVEKRGNSSKLVPVDGDYDDNCIFTEDVDLSLMGECEPDESEGEEETI